MATNGVLDLGPNISSSTSGSSSGSAATAGTAAFAVSAGTASNAGSAATSGTASNAGSAATSGSASRSGTAAFATSAGTVATAGSAAVSGSATTSGSWSGFLTGNLATMNSTSGSAGSMYFNTTYNSWFQWSVDRWTPSGLIDPRLGFRIRDEFLSNQTVQANGWLAAGTVNLQAGSFSNPGIMNITQSGSGSRSSLALQINALQLGSMDCYFEALVAFPTLATVGEDFSGAVGFNDVTTFDGSSTCTDGVQFTLNRAINGSSWNCIATSNGTSSTVTTSTVVVAGTYYRLNIMVSGTTSAVFSVNGTSVGTITTNLPIGANRQTGVTFKIDKTAGTAASQLLPDYLDLYGFFNTQRVV